MLKENLEKYKTGSFNFKTLESLRDKCNAPNDKVGVYLIYKIVNDQEVLIYIGSSGQRELDGSLKTRKGGLKDRIINGYHPNRFGQSKRIKRHKAFPMQMQVEGISELIIYWWVTYDDDAQDFPTDVESKLMNQYLTQHTIPPAWHKKK